MRNLTRNTFQDSGCMEHTAIPAEVYEQCKASLAIGVLLSTVQLDAERHD